MKKVNLERGWQIQQELSVVKVNLDAFRDKELNPTAGYLSWYGTGISPKATEQIRQIAINSLVSKRRSLQREFNTL